TGLTDRRSGRCSRKHEPDLRLPGRHVIGPAAVVALRRQYLIRPAGTQGHSLALPGADVVAERDVAVRAGAPLRLPHAEVLPERLSAVDGRLAHLLVLVDVVGATVAGDRSHQRSRRGPVRTPGINDVVLDEWVSGPSIEGQIGVAARRPRAGVVADRSI